MQHMLLALPHLAMFPILAMRDSVFWFIMFKWIQTALSH